MINEKLRFPDDMSKVNVVNFHKFPNERIQPLYADIVEAIAKHGDDVDISDVLVALSAGIISTIAIAPKEYQKQLRAQMVLRIGVGKGIRTETDPAKIAELILSEGDH